MKWTIHELMKRAKSDNSLDFTLDLKEFITEELEDLVDISETKITGDYMYDDVEEIFDFYLHINTQLIMLCALTLREVPVDLNFNTHLSFSKEYVDDDTHVIEGITIDINEYIFSEILVEKPMKIYSKDALKEYHEDIHKLDEEELMANSPFANLIKDEEE